MEFRLEKEVEKLFKNATNPYWIVNNPIQLHMRGVWHIDYAIHAI
jgi:hypothetical protein